MPADTKNPRERSLVEIERLVVSAGIQSSEFMPRLTSGLERSPDPDRSLTALHRYLQASFPTSVLRDFHAHPALQGIFLDLVGQSQYLTDILVRSPELLHWLTSTGELTTPKSARDYETESVTATEPFGRWEKKVDALKRFQRREILRVAARDILTRADMTRTTMELSMLADAIIGRMLEIGREELRRRTGTQIPDEFSVIALGKLGGEELNFSSDIDLMFVYESDGDFESTTERLKTLHELFVRLSEFVVRGLSGHTGEGHLFRVDMRLRPDGSSGPLAMSRESYRTYYESRGEVWERQMLMKARVAAGNRQTGRRFLDDLVPFVFPRTSLRNPLEAIAEVKKRIEADQEDDRNIKLGVGGIRDIEFIVQALQMLYAGPDKTLRERNSLKALSVLKDRHLLDETDYVRLTSAYLFLRNVEHRLQLMHGMQTHLLPSSDAELDLLARRLGFTSAVAFSRAVQSHRNQVRGIFDAVFQTFRPGTATKPQVPPQRVRHKGARPADSASTRAGFPDSGVEEFVRSLFREPPPHVAAIVTFLLKRDGDANWGLKNLRIVARSEAMRRLLSLGLNTPKCREVLVHLASRSEFLCRLLADEPLLLETFISRPGEALGKMAGWKFFRSNDVGRYRLYNEFRLAARFVLGKDGIDASTSALTDLAEEVVLHEWERRRREHATALGKTKCAVVALGKFGGREMMVGSDLDLVFVYRCAGRTDNRAAVAPFVREFVRSFSGTGRRLYAVDVRLRPEGKNSPLAVDFSYLDKYFRSRASLWERQSLLKARVVCGDRKLTEDVTAAIRAMAYDAPLPTRWTDEMMEMRIKIESERGTEDARGVDLKTAKGGLLDIEFAVQSIQLKYGRAHAPLRRPGTFRALEGMASVRSFSRRLVRALRGNYEFLRRVETCVRLNNEVPGARLPASAEPAPAVAAALGERSTQALSRHVLAVRRQNRLLLMKTLAFCKS